MKNKIVSLPIFKMTISYPETESPPKPETFGGHGAIVKYVNAYARESLEKRLPDSIAAHFFCHEDTRARRPEAIELQLHF